MRRELVVVILCFVQVATAQLLPDRYKETITDSVVITRDVLFSSGVPQPNPGGGFYEFVSGLPVNADENDTAPVDLYMDIFEPYGDTLTCRPVAIIAFGGGFLSGTRDHWSMELVATELAKRGYVAATIDYRLGMNIFDQDLAMRAVYRGVQDGRSAVRFFRADAATSNVYGVDPDHIYIGGHSAGGFVALHNLYLDKESERPASTRQWFDVDSGNLLPDLGGLDGAGNNQSQSGLANGGFSFAGALGFTSYIEGGEDRLTVLFHSTDDGTVPHDQGEPFGSVTILVIGSDLPEVYGSTAISARCDVVGLDHRYNSYTSRGHDVHEASSTQLYSDIIPEITDYLHSWYLEPEGLTFVSDTLVCDVADTMTYAVSESDAIYYDWMFADAQWHQSDSTMQQVEVLWSPTAAAPAVTVTPYSKMLARGSATSHQVDISAVDTLELVASGPLSWMDASIWSLNRVPEGCDHVQAPTQASATSIVVPAMIPTAHQRIRSLHAEDGVEIRLSNGALLSISR